MKKIELGQTLSIIANIGVIGGLLLLAYELQQNNELLEAQARYAGRLELPVADYRSNMLEPGALERWKETKFQYSEPFVVFMDKNIIGQQP